ncbi:MAG: hypothetical protein EOO48_02980 [Flavobacterium sp.]|nr:MAG: hypothetical protein EOO48_02980 [Flavobacterium sp.]
MKKIIFLVLLTAFSSAWCQNPVSYPKDTVGLSRPELNFEVLWHTFEDNYAFFSLRKVDWHAAYKKYRPAITASTSDDSLYACFSRMLAPFHDDHINLIVPGVRQFKSVGASQFAAEFPTRADRDQLRNVTEAELSKNGFAPLKYFGTKVNELPLFACSKSKKTGYLRFNRCFVDGDAESVPDAAAASKILDSVFTYLNGASAMIVDVRDNIGGNDEFAYEVAARFAREKIVGMYKQSRMPGGSYEEFGTCQVWYITPKGNRAAKKVVVLTSDKTVSAADVFAMIMKEIPGVTLVGSNSRGIYSDMYGFTLPNGWLVSLSNQRYYNNRHECYEGMGAPVNIRVLNTKADAERQGDPVLIAALSALKVK